MAPRSDGPFIVRVERRTVAACPYGHAMDDGYRECPACGVRRESRSMPPFTAVFVQAYETLEEARHEVRQQACRAGVERATEVDGLAEAMGSDGIPSILLPSGERITVEATTKGHLIAQLLDAGVTTGVVERVGGPLAAIVAAWNAEKGIGGGA